MADPLRPWQIEALRKRAATHRQEAKNFMRHSIFAMAQHEREAERLEREIAEAEGRRA